jgi:flagellar protein FlaJ
MAWLKKLFKKKSFFSEKNFAYPAIAGLLACFVFALVFEEIFLALALGLSCFCAVFFAMLLIPVMAEKKRVSFVERDLPFALLSISMDLDLNIAFEKCVFNASRNELATAGEFKKIFFDVKEKGLSIQEALLGFAVRNKSVAVKRAVLQLGSVYEHGSSKDLAGRIKSSEAVRRIALELLAKQRSESKAFSGKLVVFSLLFIAVSAIVPALFQSFIIVGSMILKIDFTLAQVFLAIVLGFPLVDLLVLFYIRAKTPVFLKL